MNKKIKLLLTLMIAVPLVGCGSSSNANSTPVAGGDSSTSAPISSTVDSTSSKGDTSSTTDEEPTPGPVLPTDYSSHEDFMSAEADALMMVRGKATHVYGDAESKHVYLQDGEGGYLIYGMTGDPEITIGTNYKAIGYKKVFNGQRELVDIVSFEAYTDGEITVSNKDITEMETIDDTNLMPYHDGVVTMSGTFAQDPAAAVSANKAYNVSLKLKTQTITLRIDPKIALTEFEAIGNLLKTASNNQAVTVTGICTSFGYSTPWKPQIQVVKASDITLATLTDAQIVDVVKSNLTLPYTTDKNLTFVTSLEDATISYSSDNQDVLSNTGVVTPAYLDTLVTLTITISKGSATATKEHKIYVLGTIGENHVVASTGFEDTANPEQYNQSTLKPGYAKGDVTLDGMKWTLDQSLLGGSESDKKNGNFSVRQKPYSVGSPDNATYTAEDYEYVDYVDFYAAAYGTHAPGTVVFSISTDGGTTWIEKGRYQVTGELQLIRAYTGTMDPLRIKFTYTDTTGNLNLDDVSLYSIEL